MPFLRRSAPIVIVATLGVAMHDYIREWGVIAVIGTFNLHFEDLLFALTIFYCAALARGGWRYSPLEYLNLLLCGIVLINYARGTITAGAASAGVHFRGIYAMFVAYALFVFLMHRRIEIHWVLDKIVLLGWGIVLLSVARLAFGPNAFVSPEYLGDPLLSNGLSRTLNAEPALMLGEAMLIVLSCMGSLSAGPRRRRLGTIFATFFAMLLISGQRTAIFATLAGIFAVLVALPRRRRSVVFAIGSLVLVIAAAGIYGTWIANAGDISAFLPRSIAMLSFDPSLDDNTYQWRLMQWQLILDYFWHEPLLNRIIGLPMGTVRVMGIVGGQTQEDIALRESAHSGYIESLVDLGIVGVALFVLMLVIALTKGIVLLRRRTVGHLPTNDIALAIAILVSLAIFSYSYQVLNDQGLLLAIALQIIATARAPLTKRPLFRRA